MKKIENIKDKLESQLRNEDLFNAYKTAQQLLENSEDIELIYTLGIICSRIGKVEEAKSYFENYIQSGGLDPLANLNLGHMLKAIGEIDEAKKKYRNFIKDNPKYCGQGYWYLSDLKDKNIDNHELSEITSLLTSNEINDTEKMLLQFAIGNFHDRKKCSDKAFKAFKSANEYHTKIKPFNKSAFISLVTNLKTLNSIPEFQYEDITHIPIFILGMPRSGSTLCEQILSSHSLVQATDELLFINAIAASMEKSGNYAQAVEQLTQEQAQKLRTSYIKNCALYIKSPCKYFIDKQPINFLHIGLIKTLFPEAIIINSYRNSLDNALSMYRRYFFVGHEYAYSFEDMAMYMNGYIKLMQHWESILPEQIFHCRYEDLIENSDDRIKEILAFSELPFEESCINFYENKRAVLTPSSDQVSKPIYSSSIDAWEKYLDQLPLRNVNQLSFINQQMISAFTKDNVSSDVSTWSDYWSQGNLSSFSEKNYSGVIADYWRDFSTTLSSQHKVLDLCCGNGPVLNMLYHSLRDNISPELIGVDYANVQKFGKPYQLHGNVNIESLPFENSCFSFVISQFGIEYSDLSESIKEVSRVLQPGGQFRFICHSDDSAILKENRQIYECSQSLEENSFEYFSEMLLGLDLISKNDSRGEAIASSSREKFNQSISEHHQKFGEVLFATGFPDAMKNILQYKASGQCQSIFEDYKISFAQAQKRMKQLLSAAIGEDKKADLSELLQQHKLSITSFDKIKDENTGIVGWCIEGGK